MDDARFAEIISKIAHELRSPLTSVKGFSATLLKRWDRFDDVQRLQFLETIHADAERMGRIVSEVLDLARLEAGRLELQRTSVAVGAIVDRAVAELPDLEGIDRIEIAIDADVSAWADAERLGHILGNLLENAVKFSDAGPIRVTARSIDGQVEIDVTDEGVGIETEHIDSVFEGPAGAGRKAGPSGSGLGLYLTRRLVEAHGGSIAVASVPGQGATFTVSLPTEAPEGASG